MKKSEKLKICDWSLIPLTLLMLTSGIQLDVVAGGLGESCGPAEWVWVHIAVGILFAGMCGWHLWLHFGWSDYFVRINKLKSVVTRILWWVALAAFITGFVAMIRWLQVPNHGAIGALHGKIGYLMILVAIGHVLKRRKFYRMNR